jgi:ribonucleoside-diphosphate reductase alpha chain
VVTETKFNHTRFERSGLTNDEDIRVVKSIVDYIFRWMGKKLLSPEHQEEAGILSGRREGANGGGVCR